MPLVGAGFDDYWGTTGPANLTTTIADIGWVSSDVNDVCWLYYQFGPDVDVLMKLHEAQCPVGLGNYL